MPEKQTPAPAPNPHPNVTTLPDGVINIDLFSAEKQPPLADTQAKLQGCADAIRAEADVLAREDMAHKMLEDSGARKALRRGHYTAAELEALLAEVHDLDLAVGSVGFGWKLLADAHNTKAMEELSAKEGSLVGEILQRGMDTENWLDNPATYKHLLKAAESATQNRFGTIDTWHKDGKPKQMNLALAALAEHEGFVDAYITIAAERAEAANALPAQETQKLADYRDAEQKVLADILGLPKELTANISLAIDGRTLARDDKGRLLPMGQGGGVDTKKWASVMQDIAEKARELGPSALAEVNKKCGIVNFDRYSTDQIRDMWILTRERTNENFQEYLDLVVRLRASDSRVVFSDAYGDHNGAFNGIGDNLDTDDDTAMFFEGDDPAVIHRYLALLNYHGINPSSVVFAAHGSLGLMQVGKPGEGYIVVGERTYDKNGDPADPKEVPIAGSAIGRILVRYMKPRRDTGEREVILLSCLQANRGRKNKTVIPTAEHLAEATEPDDKVAVYAGAASLNVQRTDTGDLEFLQPDPADSEAAFVSHPLEATVYRVREEKLLRPRRRGKYAGMRTAKVVRHENVKTIPGM
jgi:hypothetical protein